MGEVAVSLLFVAAAAWLVVAVSTHGSQEPVAARAVRLLRTVRTEVPRLSSLHPRPRLRRRPPAPSVRMHPGRALDLTGAIPHESRDLSWLVGRGRHDRADRPQRPITAALWLAVLIAILGIAIGSLLAAAVWRTFGAILGGT